MSSLFEGVWHREAPDLPTIQPKRRESRAPFIVAGGLLLVLVVAFFALNMTSKPKTVPEMLAEGPQTTIGALYSPETVGLKPTVQRANTSDSEGFCAGNEVICAISTIDKPAETLAKLAAALPQGQAKRYRVKVSVVPLDEE